MNIYYFDNSATTKLDNDVLKEMLPYSSLVYGNASSMYKLGRNSKNAIENSRNKIASIFNVKANEVYFTSGGTESDNTALRGIASINRKKGNHIITSRIEHPAILETCKDLEKNGFNITYLPVNRDGFVSPSDLEQAIRPSTILISIMFANNEIGTVQPIKKLAQIAHKYQIPFHTDAVQAVGNIKIDAQELGIDALSLSAHKFYGPKGIGALYVRETIPFNKFMTGGHQERNMRAGTENVAGIVGLGTALELAYNNIEENNLKISSLRNYFVSRVMTEIPGTRINGWLGDSHENSLIPMRLPGNANISFRNVKGSHILQELDNADICASAGSACSAGLLQTSHVLSAIGVPQEYINGSIRISIGKHNTKEEVDYLVEVLKKAVL